DEPDAAALELELLEPLDHDFGILAAAAVADVGQRVRAFAPAGLGVGAAHGEDQRRLAVERHQHVGRDRVPLPMAGEPLHAAAQAPMAPAPPRPPPSEAWLPRFFRAAAGSGAGIPAWRNGRRRRPGSRVSHACWRTARCGRGACAPAPTAGARTDVASGCSWETS